MNKRMFVIISMLLVLVMVGAFALVACDPTTPDDGGQTPDDGKVTVTWYDGSTELRSERVEKGSTLTSWTPEKDGHTFLGWFAEASKTDAFDFATVINEDTDIFAAFRSDAHVVDETAYYVIGTGAGDMKESNWDHASSQASETLSFVKDTTITNANVYTVTIKMYAGDRFQVCHDGSWDGQQGIGHIVGAEYCDGVNEYDGQTYTAADKKVACVKNAENEVVFTGSDEYNKSFEVWNIVLADGQDGIYKFTYTTYPGQAGNNTLTWELVEAIEPMAQTHDMYLVGTLKEGDDVWQDDATVEDRKLTKSADGSTWTIVVTITEEMYPTWGDGEHAYVKVKNAISGSDYGIGGENIALAAGSYIITYKVEDNSITVQAEDPAYYIVGTLVGADNAIVNFVINTEVCPKLTLNETTGLYEATINVADVTTLSEYSWLATQEAGIFAIQVVYGTSAGVTDWYGIGENGDNLYFAEEGVYNITFNAETGEITSAKEEPAYYIAGTLVDAEGNNANFGIFKGTSPKLTYNATTGFYEVEIEVTDVSAREGYTWLAGQGIFAIKVVHGTSLGVDAQNGWFSSATTGDNHYFATAGTYLVQFDETAGTFTVTPVA